MQMCTHDRSSLRFYRNFIFHGVVIILTLSPNITAL